MSFNLLDLLHNASPFAGFHVADLRLHTLTLIISGWRRFNTLYVATLCSYHDFVFIGCKLHEKRDYVSVFSSSSSLSTIVLACKKCYMNICLKTPSPPSLSLPYLLTSLVPSIFFSSLPLINGLNTTIKCNKKIKPNIWNILQWLLTLIFSSIIFKTYLNLGLIKGQMRIPEPQ